MKEVVVLRLGSQHQDPVHWLVWSPENQPIDHLPSEDPHMVAQGILDSAEALSTLIPWCSGREVRVLVPGCDVLLRTVTFPGKLTAQSIKALPFLLEDELAGDPESLHLVVLHRESAQVHVACVDTAQMQLWLDWLSEASITPTALYPDVLALPAGDDQNWSAVQLGEQWLIRQSTYQGVVLEPELLATWLACHDEQPIIGSYSPVPGGRDWKAHPEQAALSLLAQSAPSKTTNLLQGSFLPVSASRERLKVWRTPAMLALSWLLLLGVYSGISFYQLRLQQASLQQQMQTVYRHTFPQEKRVVNPYVQFKQHLSAQGSPASNGFLVALSAISPTLTAQKNVKVQRLHFDEKTQRLELRLQGDSFTTFEGLKKQALRGFTAELSDMTQQQGKVSGVLTLKEKS